MTFAHSTLTDYLVSNFGLEEDEFDDDTLLFSDGLLDSFCMINLISFIETETGIRFRPAEVNLDNLDSVARILGYLERKSQ